VAAKFGLPRRAGGAGAYHLHTASQTAGVFERSTIMKTASVALATMVLTATGAPTFAQPVSTMTGPEHSRKLMARLDADKDGKITREETEAARKQLFARLDRNGDGLVDEEEMDRARQAIIDRATMMETRLSMQWRNMDKDGDGKVSAEEFQSRTVVFDLADRNGDGAVTAEEIDVLRTLLSRAGLGKAG
jgi:hypothetical protein